MAIQVFNLKAGIITEKISKESYFKVHIQIEGGSITVLFVLQATRSKPNVIPTKQNKNYLFNLPSTLKPSQSVPPSVSSHLSTSLFMSALLLACDIFFVFEPSFAGRRQVDLVFKQNPQDLSSS